MKTPSAAFRPTAAQRRFLDYVHSNPSYQTIQELCTAAGVDPSSYYKWCHDPGFCAWLSRVWSGRLLFEGWHMLNLARANMVRSPTHFRALFSLVFDPRGQAALDAWQHRLAAANGENDSAGSGEDNTNTGASHVENDVESNQQLGSRNSSFSQLAAARNCHQPSAHPLPAIVARQPGGHRERPSQKVAAPLPGAVARHLSRALNDISAASEANSEVGESDLPQPERAPPGGPPRGRRSLLAHSAPASAKFRRGDRRRQRLRQAKRGGRATPFPNPPHEPIPELRS